MNLRFPLFLTAAGSTALFVASNLSAAPAAGSEAPTSSAYTNQTPPSPPAVDYSSSNNYNGSYLSSSSSFGDNRLYGVRDSFFDYPQDYFYFPPVAPPLGELTRRGYSGPSFTTTSSWRSRSAHTAPITPQLAQFVGEGFYSPLATHLHNEDLTKKQHAQLAAYRETRSDLVSALHAKLDALKAVDAPTRARELAAFAQEQAPRIDAFEQEAEAIRTNLVRGGFFHSGVRWEDWDANRSWRLGDDLRYESRVDEFKVIRAAAYFYPNLIPAQRRLLQELAMELNEPLTDSSAGTALDAPDPYFYLSPETARVHLPANLPDDLSAKIAAYQKEKSALKEELRATIYKLDRSWFHFTRRPMLEQLAEQQAPRIAALENLAEDIRRGLAEHPNPNRLNRTHGSSEVARRIAAYTREREQLIALFQAKMEEVRKAFPTARIEANVSTTTARISVFPNRNQTKAEAKAFPAFQQELMRFQDDMSQRFSALERSKITLRSDVLKSTAIGNTTSLAAAKTFAAEVRRNQIQELFDDYDYAVFEPGLSPGQRRLLYIAGLQKLTLPIPGGSSQP